MSYTTVEERQREKIIELEARIAELENARAKAVEGRTKGASAAWSEVNMASLADDEEYEWSLKCCDAIALMKDLDRMEATIASQAVELERMREVVAHVSAERFPEVRAEFEAIDRAAPAQAEPQAKPCTGAEFVEAAQAAIQPRTDEEIREALDMYDKLLGAPR